MAPRPIPVEQRFWPKVDKRGPDECWEWTGTKNEQGYGAIRDGGRMIRANRLAWEMANGRRIPDGMHVCHTCDNPPCCNPAHLWLGTVFDNMADRSRKGRHPQQRKTHCAQGHPYSEQNTYRVPEKGFRRCRICVSNWSRRRYDIRRARLNEGSPQHV